jgi:IS1 family transposase
MSKRARDRKRAERLRKRLDRLLLQYLRDHWREYLEMHPKAPWLIGGGCE